MHTTTLSFANLHNYGELFANILRARKESFIERNNWDLPEAMGMEYDQYDTPASRWVAVHDNLGTVYAGVRLTPTIAQCGIYSYMIRDAQNGLLRTIPRNCLDFRAPMHPNVWEASRVFVAQSTPANMRRQVHTKLVAEMTATSRALGIVKALALLPANWSRWARRRDLRIERAGPVLMMDGIDYQAVVLYFSGALH